MKEGGSEGEAAAWGRQRPRVMGIVLERERSREWLYAPTTAARVRVGLRVWDAGESQDARAHPRKCRAGAARAKTICGRATTECKVLQIVPSVLSSAALGRSSESSSSDGLTLDTSKIIVTFGSRPSPQFLATQPKGLNLSPRAKLSKFVRATILIARRTANARPLARFVTARTQTLDEFSPLLLVRQSAGRLPSACELWPATSAASSTALCGQAGGGGMVIDTRASEQTAPAIMATCPGCSNINNNDKQVQVRVSRTS